MKTESKSVFNQTPFSGDLVLVEGLEVPAVIGIFDWEQDIQQPLVVDVAVVWDNRIPAASGSIDDALDYDRLSRAIQDWIQEKPYGLIEEVAEVLADRILHEFKVAAVQLKVAKPTAVKAARSVAVQITRYTEGAN
ncbi:dihydroneopterin aldolase [Aliidiomarina halalkaliphila]|uniref:7,8-dihydroneopterin aldolase n=1 Tax=Aliidiomarina halalkaliphila TaxID=2593535 RepID=A0A552WYP5_9GAMM|nr:dihydroneopterin aldolase [Aliidiomarina halalkaliphila]TRW47942.1 dihydroneopterin aldolase [Aliidiomarina halalkaliphila]